MPPTVPPSAQVRAPRAPIAAQDSRHFDDLVDRERRPRDQFAGKFHPFGAQAEIKNPLPSKAAQTTMEITDADSVKEPAQETEDRIAKVSVKERHRARLDAA